MVNNGVDIENVLYENIELPESVFGMGNFNNSHYFLLPLFDIRGIGMFRSNYIGTYIGDNGRQCNLECPLFILLRFKELNNNIHLAADQYFASMPTYIFNYYAGHNEGSLVMYVLRARPEERQVYKTLVSGKYSQVPEWYVNKSYTFPFMTATRQRLKAICLKEDWHKQHMENDLGVDLEGRELWNTFEEHREIYRYVQK